MQEIYRALHEIARKISRRREIDLQFSPPIIELEDTRYVVTDLNGLRDRLSKIADDPNLSDSFNECYNTILEAICSCAVLPNSVNQNHSVNQNPASIKDRIFELSQQSVFRPHITQTEILWQLACGVTTCPRATPFFPNTQKAEDYAIAEGWFKIVDGPWVCPEHARLLGENPRVGGLYSFWANYWEWFEIQCGANWEAKGCHQRANAAKSIDGASREAEQAGWKKIFNGPWCCPAHWDALLKAGIECETI